MSNITIDKKWFITLFIVNFCISLGFCMTDSFFSVYYKSLGAGASLIGLSVASYQIAKVISGPVCGKVADSKGYIRVIFISIVLYLCVAAAFLTIRNTYLLILMRIIQGIACAAFRPVIYSLINFRMNKVGRSETFGTFDISFYSALAAGPLAGGLVSKYFGIAGIFYVTFVLCIIALVLCTFLAKEKSNTSSVRTVYKFNFKCSKTEIAMYVFIFGKAAALACFTIYYPIYLIGNGLSPFETGFALSCSSIGMCIFIKPMGWIADNSSRHLMILIGGCAVSLAYFYLPGNASFYSTSVFSFLCGFFGAMSQPAGVSLLMRNGYPGRDASVMGIFNSVMGIGFAFGAILASGITDRFGIHDAFMVTGLFSLISSWLFFIIVKNETIQPRYVRESLVHKN